MSARLFSADVPAQHSPPASSASTSGLPASSLPACRLPPPLVWSVVRRVDIMSGLSGVPNGPGCDERNRHENGRTARKVSGLLRVEGAYAACERRVGPHVGSVGPVHAGRDEPVQRPFSGEGEAGVHAGHDLPEVSAHGGHRERRSHGVSPHVLRDAGQFQFRRLLQAGGDPLGLAVLHGQEVAGDRPGAVVGLGVPGRRRGGEHLDGRDRAAEQPH